MAQDRARGKRQVFWDILVRKKHRAAARKQHLLFLTGLKQSERFLLLWRICGPRLRRLHGSSPSEKRHAARGVYITVMCTLDAHDSAPRPAAARSLREVMQHEFQYRRMTHGTGTTRPLKKPCRSMV